MGVYVQMTPKGAVFIMECSVCKRDRRVPCTEGTFKEVVKKYWTGVAGCFNGRWEFICRLCQSEAETGVHVSGWRWGFPW